MRFRLISKVIGALLFFIAGSHVFPLIVSIIYRDGDTSSFIMSIIFTAILAGILYFPFRKESREINHRDGFLIVTGGWV